MGTATPAEDTEGSNTPVPMTELRRQTDSLRTDKRKEEEMTLTEAKEMLWRAKGQPLMPDSPRMSKALQLGIEALERIQHLRDYSMTQVDTRLPGETDE